MELCAVCIERFDCRALGKVIIVAYGIIYRAVASAAQINAVFSGFRKMDFTVDHFDRIFMHKIRFRSVGIFVAVFLGIGIEPYIRIAVLRRILMIPIEVFVYIMPEPVFVSRFRVVVHIVRSVGVG